MTSVSRDNGGRQQLSFYVIVGVLFCCSLGCRALTCYHCDSFQTGDCGPLFRASSDVHTVDCDSDVTLCVLQRQPAIPQVRQLAAIYRTCYEPDQSDLLRGINTSLGCRMWTNANNFTALYCFCDTDLCNSAPSHIQLSAGRRWVNLGVVAVAVGTLVLLHARVTKAQPSSTSVEFPFNE